MIARPASATVLAIALLAAGCSSRDPGGEGTPSGKVVDTDLPVTGGLTAKGTAAVVPVIAPSMPSAVSDPAVTASLRSFDGRDTNHDGIISSAENAVAADHLFDAIDADGDGELTRTEIDAARRALGLVAPPSTALLIARADQDGDGQLTLAEWIARSGRDFRDGDVNHDGGLSRQEFAGSQVLHPPAAPVAAAATPLATPGGAGAGAGAGAGHAATAARRSPGR